MTKLLAGTLTPYHTLCQLTSVAIANTMSVLEGMNAMLYTATIVLKELNATIGAVTIIRIDSGLLISMAEGRYWTQIKDSREGLTLKRPGLVRVSCGTQLLTY